MSAIEDFTGSKSWPIYKTLQARYRRPVRVHGNPVPEQGDAIARQRADTPLPTEFQPATLNFTS